MVKIVKIPFSKGGLNKTEGCELAPDQIIKESQELYLNESKKQVKLKTSEIKVNNYNISESFKRIEEYTKKLVTKENNKKDNEIIVFLGGDHSITYPIINGIHKNIKNIGLIIFDAHPDCENYFKPPTHEDYLRVLVDDKIIDVHNILLIGLRNWDHNEIEYIEDNKIRYITTKEIYQKGYKWYLKNVIDFSKKHNQLYCSVDIDVIDPAFAPATGYIEPAGIFPRDILSVISKIKDKILFLDIVEINPKKDINNMTSKLAAKIIWELN